MEDRAGNGIQKEYTEDTLRVCRGKLWFEDIAINDLLKKYYCIRGRSAKNNNN